MTKQLVEQIADLREEEALQLAKEQLDSGADPMSVLDDCRQAMTVVGKRFEQGQAFVPDLIFAGEIMRQISEMAKPKLGQTTAPQKHGRVLVGTVK